MRITAHRAAVLILSVGIVALFLFSSIPAQALTPPPGPFPGLNPLCDYPANTKVYFSWNGWTNEHGVAVGIPSPIIKNTDRVTYYNAPYDDDIAIDYRMTSGVQLYQFRMASSGPFHLNPSATWNAEAFPYYILAEWDECWLNDNGTITRVHHSDYTDDHQQIRAAYDVPINSVFRQPGMAVSGSWQPSWFDFYTQDAYQWNQDHTAGADPTGETDHRRTSNVTWTENLYLNGSATHLPLGWAGSNNPYDPGENNFMAMPPAVYIPLLFDETYVLRMDWLDYDYTQYQSSTPFPSYPAVIDGAGLNTIAPGASGAIYVDRQQLDRFLENDSIVGHLNLTQRAQLYAWCLMIDLRLQDLSDRLTAITHTGGLNEDADRCKANGQSLLWIAENYGQAARYQLATNGTAAMGINATQGAWMNYESANYYQAAAVVFNDDDATEADLALAAEWEARAYALTSLQFADAQPDYSDIYEANGELPANETAGLLDWIVANPGLVLSVAGLALSILAAMIRNPWFLIVSIIVTMIGILAYALGY